MKGNQFGLGLFVNVYETTLVFLYLINFKLRFVPDNDLSKYVDLNFGNYWFCMCGSRLSNKNSD